MRGKHRWSGEDNTGCDRSGERVNRDGGRRGNGMTLERDNVCENACENEDKETKEGGKDFFFFYQK